MKHDQKKKEKKKQKGKKRKKTQQTKCNPICIFYISNSCNAIKMEVFERSMFEIGGIKSALFIKIISLKVAGCR